MTHPNTPKIIKQIKTYTTELNSIIKPLNTTTLKASIHHITQLNKSSKITPYQTP